MANELLNNPWDLPSNSYAAFDATSLKSLMIQRLNEGGVFTDQIYEGSNFNTLLDVIAYSYSVLLYYLNKTGSESLYSQSQIYENMNKIVKSLNYNPVGFQTSVLSFSAVAPSTLAPGSYTIPRYSYFTIDGIPYSFSKDVTFQKTNNGREELSTLFNSTLLYQGSFLEFPIYLATGQPFEQFSITTVGTDATSDIVDHTNIYVYVLDKNGQWSQWNRVNSLYLEGPTSKSFECRFNENQRYVIKFGNNVTGLQLDPGNAVAVYYLKSNGAAGEIGPGDLDGNRLFLYNSQQYNTIVRGTQTTLTYLNQNQAAGIEFTNTLPSSLFGNLEDVTSLRNNAANTFKTQYRLVTTQDYETYIKTNYGNVVQDLKVVNNWEYTAQYLKYFYDIGLKTPNQDSRVLFNQVNFADSCDFNNVYVFVVPRIQNTNSIQINSNFLGAGLKSLIIDGIQGVKMTTTEVVVVDPVYVGVGIGVGSNNEINSKLLTPDLINETSLVVVRSADSRYSEIEVKEQVTNIIKQYFSLANTTLGQQINLDQITSKILAIDGVESFTCRRTVNNQEIVRPGLSLLMFNPVYSNPGEDIEILDQSKNLPFFKIPYYYNPDTLINQIQVSTTAEITVGVREY